MRQWISVARLIGGLALWKAIGANLPARHTEPEVDADRIVTLVVGSTRRLPQQARGDRAYRAASPAEVDEFLRHSSSHRSRGMRSARSDQTSPG